VVSTLEAPVNLTFGMNFHVAGVHLTFPANGGASQYQPGSVLPKNTRESTVSSVSLIPLYILEMCRHYSLFVPALKVHSRDLNFDGSVEAHVIPKLNFQIVSLMDKLSAGVSMQIDSSSTLTFTKGKSNSKTGGHEKRRSAKHLVSPSQLAAGGCVEFKAASVATGTANGNFFDLSKGKTNMDLFNSEWELFSVSSFVRSTQSQC
jgi:hypothetical protein